MSQNKSFLDEIFNRLTKLGLSSLDREPEDEFYEEWFSLCQKYTTEEVLVSWNAIKYMESWNYYNLKTWRDKLDYNAQDRILKKRDQEQTIQQKEYQQRDKFIGEIKKKAQDYFSGQYTRQELIDMGIADAKTILMWESALYPLDKPIGVHDWKAYKKEMMQTKYKWIFHREGI